MTDTRPDLTAIKARAEAATGGPWWPEGKVIGGWRIYARDREQAPDFTEVGSVREVFVATGQHVADAAHIAGMDPTTTLALVAELERAQAAVRQAFDAVDWNSDGYNPGVGRAILRAALTPDAES